MKFVDPDIDHIDPRWKDGRDYQLVCGLDCALNYCERETKFNIAKSNRFLPWRYCPDEIGTIPVEQGDLCQFLIGADIANDIPGEWVLMEFLSEEWFAASKLTCGSHFAGKSGKNADPNHIRERNIKGNAASIPIILQWMKDNPERHREIARMGGQSSARQMKENPEQTSHNRKIAGKFGANAQHSQRIMCTVTGFISTPTGISRYQRARGIDPSNRVKLPSEEPRSGD
jgi:hypothetical protein